MKNFKNSALVAPRSGQRRPWYAFSNKTETSVNLQIMEEIGGWGISARGFARDLQNLPEDITINLHICCAGGSVTDGNEIYNLLSKHKGNIDITLGALCASIATVIAMAGTTIKMAKNGMFMIHNPWTIAAGDSAEMRKNAEIMDKFKATIISAYKSRVDKTDEELADLMDAETWMLAEEALEHGFIDEISGEYDEEEDEILDRVDLSRFKNTAKPISHYEATGAASSSANLGNKGGKQTGEIPPAENQTKPKENNMTPEEIAAAKAAKEKEIAAAAKKMYEARMTRESEIDTIVLAIRKREGKCFGKLATQAKNEEWSPEQFALAITKSDDFQPFKAEGSKEVGSGVEVIGVQGLPVGTPGELFVASEEYRGVVHNMKKGSRKHAAVLVETGGFQNTTTTSTGLTSIEKLPGVVTLGVRPLMVKDLIAPGQTGSTTIRYIREVSFTNAATTVAEGAAKPEASFDLEEVNATVKKIAAWTKVTDELFQDYLAVASYINQRLPYMVSRTEEDQILDGDGTGNNIEGIMQTTGIQTQAKATDTAIDAVYKAMTKVRFTGFFEPDGIIMHPTDWEAIRLTKDLNNQYLAGGPFTGAYGNGMPVQFEMLWGKPVVVTPVIAQGSALVGAFRLGSQYFQRSGLTVESTNTDQDDFIKNLVTIRAETRLALAVYRALAFCEVTGL